MADIELVVKIPEEEYRWIIKSDETVFASIASKECMLHAIKNGTPLPKRHGKLFDENELKKEAIRCEWSRQMYDTLDHTLSYMKPIIEADKENYNCDGWCNTCEYKHLESECLGCAKYDEYDNLITLSNYKKESEG